MIFLECSSMLNDATVANPFLSYTWLDTRKLVNFVYLKVLFAKSKNELSILSSISFLHHKSLKNKTFSNVLEFRQQICHWNVLNVLGLLINNSSAIQFSNKFQLILCKNWGTSYKDCYSSNQSLVWSASPGEVLNQRIHFAF